MVAIEFASKKYLTPPPPPEGKIYLSFYYHVRPLHLHMRATYERP